MMLIQLDDWVMMIENQLTKGSCHMALINAISYIYITPLVLIQHTDVEQNAVKNNWLLKLQPAVKLQSWQKSNFNQIVINLQSYNFHQIVTTITK